ncbi:hypothetical protein M3J09_006803 [Ascochyta lentis]
MFRSQPLSETLRAVCQSRVQSVHRTAHTLIPTVKVSVSIGVPDFSTSNMDAAYNLFGHGVCMYERSDELFGYQAAASAVSAFRPI